MPATAQTDADRAAIKSMCGCYAITFDYAETFHPDTAYKIHKPYHAAASAEWIFAIEDSKDKIVLQHLLQVSDSMIIKHWRQDWLYQNTALYEFNQPGLWKFTKKSPESVKGQWTQKVFQVDDSPRYEASASWIHADGRRYWEATTDAPLPRREFTKRSDYNVLERTNRHLITGSGWTHDENNRKIIRSSAGDKWLASEKGLNVYTKIPDEKCASAQKWWSENERYWAVVRAEWDRVFARNTDLKLVEKMGDEMLWETLFEIGDREKANTDTAAVAAMVREAMKPFIDPVSQGASTY